MSRYKKQADCRLHHNIPIHSFGIDINKQGSQTKTPIPRSLFHSLNSLTAVKATPSHSLLNLSFRCAYPTTSSKDEAHHHHPPGHPRRYRLRPRLLRGGRQSPLLRCTFPLPTLPSPPSPDPSPLFPYHKHTSITLSAIHTDAVPRHGRRRRCC